MSLERGDPITVVMARNDVFPFQSGPSFDAVLVYSPGGPGDSLIVRVDVDAPPPFGTQRYHGEVYLNPSASDFIAILRTDGEATDGE